MRVRLVDEERQVAFGERLGMALAWRGRLYRNIRLRRRHA